MSQWTLLFQTLLALLWPAIPAAIAGVWIGSRSTPTAGFWTGVAVFAIVEYFYLFLWLKRGGR